MLMKRLAISIFFVLLAMTAFSQDELYSDLPDDNNSKTPAYHLKKAGSFFQISGGLAVGSGLAAVASVQDIESSDRELLLIGSGVAGVGSLVTYFIGANHLQKAGALMAKDKVSIQGTASGIGIVYKF